MILSSNETIPFSCSLSDTLFINQEITTRLDELRCRFIRALIESNKPKNAHYNEDCIVDFFDFLTICLNNAKEHIKQNPEKFADMLSRIEPICKELKDAIEGIVGSSSSPVLS
jgi:hypothetical protein